MLRQGVTAGGGLMLKDLKPNRSLILSTVGWLKITHPVIVDLIEKWILFCFQNSASGFIGIITRTNEDRRGNYGLLFLLNMFNHTDVNANIFFFIHYISIASWLHSVTSWPWVTDPHYQFSNPSYSIVCVFKALCYKYILCCRSVACINEITSFSVNMFTPSTFFLPTPVRPNLWCWPSVCFDFSHFEQIIFYFQRSL